MFGFLSRQALLSGVVVLFALPFVIFYITSSRFLQRNRSKTSAKSPPTIPFHIPGVFHALALATTGPQTYIANLLKVYKDDDPFFIFAGPQPFLIVRDPDHVRKIVKASQSDLHNVARLETFDKLYASPQSALDLYAGKGSEADLAALKDVHLALTKKYLTGAPLSANIESYIAVLSSNLNDKMFQTGSWTQIEDTWSFLQQVFTRCVLTSLFGSDLFKQYPNIVKDYWAFVEAIEGFLPGLPRYWVPGAAAQIQERLHRGIEKWLKANHSGSEFARIADEDPVLNDLKGSKFVQERDDRLAKIDGIDLKARAAEMLSIIHGSTIHLVPCMIWSVLELARRPKVAQKLTADVSRYSPSQGATYNIHDITQLQLMKSLHAETVRLRVAALLMHTERESLALDKHWTAPGGVPMVAFSHNVALNPIAWQDTPHSTQRPLEEYWPERFLLHGRTISKPNTDAARSGAAPGGGDLEPMNMISGSVYQTVLGSDYAQATHAATLAVLLDGFEIQLCDTDHFDAVLPPTGDLAFGMLKPLDTIPVRIRKRSA